MKRRQFLKTIGATVCGLPVSTLLAAKTPKNRFDAGILKDMNLGVMNPNEVRYYEGIITEISMSGRELTSQEIADLFQIPIATVKHFSSHRVYMGLRRQ